MKAEFSGQKSAFQLTTASYCADTAQMPKMVLVEGISQIIGHFHFL
ncbi:hypothetical protein [Nocardia africana]|nr:hypothetical protein [Nocardia africana]